MLSTNAPFRPGEATLPTSQIELSISCRNLENKDLLSKSDPMCVLFMKHSTHESFKEVNRTEIIPDNLNPDFVKKFLVNYSFEEYQQLKLSIYDIDSNSSTLTDHDFLGSAEMTLGEIVGSGSGHVERPLNQGSRRCGSVIVHAEEVIACKEIVNLHMKATNLDKKDFFGKSDPYLEFHRANENGSFTVIHRTEYVKNSLNPTWRPFSLSARILCNGDHDRLIKIKVWDWNNDGSSDLIGECDTTLRELVKGPGSSNVYEVVNPSKKAKSRKYQNSGQLHLISCRISQDHTFLDYITSGMEMNFTVAIDFTASNGNPSQPDSLHYLTPHGLNWYSAALRAVGDIIQDYDSDKMFPALGFGAKIPPNGAVSHEFPLNFTYDNPYCAGIDGILQVYYSALRQVQLYGPTNFSPVINHVANFARAILDGSHYFVLLIITDGVISDMPQTIDAIVNASSLPMSIIIVGVGNADFSAMDVLDADGKLLQSRGRTADRDIVQFVPYQEVMSRYGNDMNQSKANLAREVLAEIPGQVVGYMRKHQIAPREKVPLAARASAPPQPFP